MCKKKGHAKETYYPVVCYPLDYKFKKKFRGYNGGNNGARMVNANSTTAAGPFGMITENSVRNLPSLNNERRNQIMQLINNPEKYRHILLLINKKGISGSTKNITDILAMNL